MTDTHRASRAVEAFNANQAKAEAKARTPAGLRCVHLQGCRVYSCCDLLDDCIDQPFPRAASGPTRRPDGFGHEDSRQDAPADCGASRAGDGV